MTGRLRSALAAAAPLLDDHVAATDCERLIRLWADVPAQPINTLSSLAMSSFGLFLVRRSRRWSEPARRRTPLLVGLALVSTGIGSALYHGPGGLVSQVLHDVTIAAVPMAAVIGMLGERHRLNVARWLAAALAATTVLQVVGPSHLVAGGLAVLVLIRLGVDRDRRGLTHRAHLVLGGVLLVAARTAFALSRTGGPLCRPDSVLQGHALWHLLAAAGIVALASGLGLLPAHPRYGRQEPPG